MALLVTTTLLRRKSDEELAKVVAKDLGGYYLPRRRTPMENFWRHHTPDKILVIDDGQIVCHTPKGHRLFFHPGLAKVRIRCLQQGGKDWLVESLRLQEGDEVLDANLGLATDALVIAFITRRCIIGLEKDPLIGYITRHGLQTYPTKRFPEGSFLFPLIQVKVADHTEYIQKMPSASVDSIYFSPMFIKPKFFSADREALREIAVHDFLSEKVMEEARRVARKRVVVKLNKDRPEEVVLPPGYILQGGKRSRVEYAVYS